MAINAVDGKLIKMEVDYSDAVAAQLPKSLELVRAGHLPEALDAMIVLEKQARQGQDTFSSVKILCGIISLCAEAKDYEKLCEMMVLLTKRRSQFKQVMSCTQFAFEYPHFVVAFIHPCRVISGVSS